VNKYNDLIAELRSVQARLAQTYDVLSYMRAKNAADALDEIQSSIFICPQCAKEFTLTGPTEK